MNSFSGNSQNIAIAENSILWTTFNIVADSMGLSSAKAAKFGRITENNGHYAVQGHSKSPTLVPLKAYMRRTFLMSNT